MFKTAGNSLLGIGALVSLVGLLFLPAAFNGHRAAGDESLLGVGLTIFATGALLAAGGFYAKARLLTAKVMSDPNLRSPGEKRRGACELCHNGLPVITCTIHKRNLCATCLVDHYEPIACVYIPALWQSGGKKAQGRAMQASVKA